MQWLKLSTAFTEIIGPILDSAGAEYTGAVIGDLSISKNGTEAAMASAATLTHVSNGHYTLVGTTGNSDTLGRLTIRCNKATYQCPQRVFMVLPATVYDALVTNAGGAVGGFVLNGSSNAGTTTFGALAITGLMSVGDGVSISCATTDRSALTLSPNGKGSSIVGTKAIFTSDFTVGGDFKITGGLSVGGDFAVTGAATITGPFTATHSSNDLRGIALHGTQAAYAPVLATTGATIQAKTDLIPAAPASTTNISAGTITLTTTATNLTNLPTIPTNWIDANGIKADAVTKIQSGLATPTNISAATVTLSGTQGLYAPSKAGDAMALTSGERTTLAAAVWNALTSGLTTTGSIGKRLVDFVTSLVYSAPLDAAGTRSAVGLASANLDTQLAAITAPSEGDIDAYLSAQHGSGSWGSTAAGTGANPVVCHVQTPGAVVLEGAFVRATINAGATTASGYSAPTTGNITLSLNSGTWVITATLANYILTGIKLTSTSSTANPCVIAGADTITITMTANTPTPSTEPETTTAYGVVKDMSNVGVEGETVTIRPTGLVTGFPAGSIYVASTRSAVTDSDGVFEFVDLPVGFTYSVTHNRRTERVSIALDAESTTEIASFLA